MNNMSWVWGKNVKGGCLSPKVGEMICDQIVLKKNTKDKIWVEIVHEHISVLHCMLKKSRVGGGIFHLLDGTCIIAFKAECLCRGIEDTSTKR